MQSINGLEVVEGLLFTTADLTKQMKHSFALQTLIGIGGRGHVVVKPQQNRRKEGVRACVYVYVCERVKLKCTFLKCLYPLRNVFFFQHSYLAQKHCLQMINMFVCSVITILWRVVNSISSLAINVLVFC